MCVMCLDRGCCHKYFIEGNVTEENLGNYEEASSVKDIQH